MAIAAVGSGPFEFTDADGHQRSIPLSAFSFDATGTLVVADAWKQEVLNSPPASALLAYAQAEGFIKPAVAPSPTAAVIVKAADLGTGGNNITITVQNIQPASHADPTKTTFDIIVSETDTYAGLTVATIKGLLGTDKTPGTAPGLVVIDSSVPIASTGVPAALPPTKLNSTTSRLEIDDSSSLPQPLFALEAKKPGADDNLTTVEISNIVNEGFDLTVAWTKTVTGVTIGTLQKSVTDNLSYEVMVKAPAGGVFSVPAAGATQLSGGASGVAAAATLFASS